MILAVLTISGSDHYVGDRSIHLSAHYYQPYLDFKRYAPPVGGLSHDTGGFWRYVYGSICVSPAVFKDDWPPPEQIEVSDKYLTSGETNEALAVIIGSGIAYLGPYGAQGVQYDRYDTEYHQQLLQEREDINGNRTVVPMLFGEWAHAKLLEVPDPEDYGIPTYMLDGISVDKDLVSASITGVTIIPGTSITFHANANNPVLNGEFEYGTAAWAAGNGATLSTIAPTVANYGSCLKILEGVSANPYAYQTGIRVRAGGAYQLRIRLWDALGGGSNPVVAVYDEDNSAWIVAGTSLTGGITYWNSAYVPFTAPAGCTRITVYIQHTCAGGGATYYNFDSVEIVGHGFSNGDSLTIEGTPDHEGTYVIGSATYNSFVIPTVPPIAKTYRIVAFVSQPPYVRVYLEDFSPPIYQYAPVTIIGTTNYNGSYQCEAFYTDGVAHSILITATYVAETPGAGAGLYISAAYTPLWYPGNVYLSSENALRIFDDGVAVSSNFMRTPDDEIAFQLSATPVGTVTVCVEADRTTLVEIFTWAAVKLGLSIDTTDARSPSPEISVCINSQCLIVDFLAEIAAYHTHFFRISGGTLYLVDMFSDVGVEVSLTRNQRFEASYMGPRKICAITGTWQVRQVLRNAEIAGIEDAEVTVSVDMEKLVDGTTTSSTAYKLKDSGATFVSDGVTAGMYAFNRDTGETALVSSVDSDTQLTLDADIFPVSGPYGAPTSYGYVVGPRSPNGEKINITAYEGNESAIREAMWLMMDVLCSQRATVSLPIAGAPPTIGQKVSWTDTRTPADTSAWIRARDIRWDLARNRYIIEGEGAIS